MYRTFFHLTYTLAVIYVYKEKTPSEDTNLTFFHFITQERQARLSEMKRSGITKLAAKIRVLEVVAMETVTHSLFFQWPISQQGVKLLS